MWPLCTGSATASRWPEPHPPLAPTHPLRWVFSVQQRLVPGFLHGSAQAATGQVRKFTPLASYLEKQLGTVIAAWLGLVLAVPASRVGQQDPAWLRSPPRWLTR